jgi:hypothetical protein
MSIADPEDPQISIPVYKTFMCKTYDISDFKLKQALHAPELPTSKKLNVGRRKLDNGELRQKIISFLQSLTTYETHSVIESSPHRQYLNDPTLSSIADVEKFFKKCAKNSQILDRFLLVYFLHRVQHRFQIPMHMDECTACLWYEGHHRTADEPYIIHKFRHKLSATYYKTNHRAQIPKKTLVVSLDLVQIYDSPTSPRRYLLRTIYPYGLHIHNDNNLSL